MAKVNNAELNQNDIMLTKSNGKRLLVDAFSIAAVEELDEGSNLTLKVPVAAATNYGSYRSTTGMQVRVKETIDEIVALKNGL